MISERKNLILNWRRLLRHLKDYPERREEFNAKCRLRERERKDWEKAKEADGRDNQRLFENICMVAKFRLIISIN